MSPGSAMNWFGRDKNSLRWSRRRRTNAISNVRPYSMTRTINLAMSRAQSPGLQNASVQISSCSVRTGATQWRVSGAYARAWRCGDWRVRGLSHKQAVATEGTAAGGLSGGVHFRRVVGSKSGPHAGAELRGASDDLAESASVTPRTTPR